MRVRACVRMRAGVSTLIALCSPLPVLKPLEVYDFKFEPKEFNVYWNARKVGGARARTWGALRWAAPTPRPLALPRAGSHPNCGRRPRARHHHAAGGCGLPRGQVCGGVA